MSERTPGYGAPDRMGDWTDEPEQTVTEGDIEIPENYTSMTRVEKLKNPTVRKVLELGGKGLGAVAIASVLMGGGYALAKNTMEQDAQMMKQIKEQNIRSNTENLKERLATSNVSEEDIKMILNDPELQDILKGIEEERPEDIVEYFERKGILEEEG